MSRALLRDRAAWLVLAAVTVTAAIVVLRHGRGLTFYYDEWNFVMNRVGHAPDVFLRPHNEHASLFGVAVYKALFEVVGLSHYWVYLATHVLLCEALAVAVYVYARPRVGDWWALVPAVAMALVGSAPDYVLQTFELTFGLSLLAGVCALIAFDRGTRRADAAGCSLLVVAVFSSGIGLPMLAIAILDTAWREDRAVRWWIPAVPAALYALWWLGYTPDGSAEADNLIHAPRYAEEMYLAGTRGLTTLDALAPAAALLIAVYAVVMATRGPRPRLWALLGGALAFWVLTAIARYGWTPADHGRYLYPSAALIALVCAEMLRGRLPAALGRRGWVVAAVLVAGLFLNNIGLLQAEKTNIRDLSRFMRPELAALELAGPETNPGYVPDATRAPDIVAGKYFAALDRYGGSPAASLAEVAGADAEARAEADRVLREALALAPGPFRAPLPAECTTEGAAAVSVSVAPGRTLVVRGEAPVQLSVRRFADAAVSVGPAPASQRTALAFPSDRGADHPWTVELATPDRFTYCVA